MKAFKFVFLLLCLFAQKIKDKVLQKTYHYSPAYFLRHLHAKVTISKSEQIHYFPFFFSFKPLQLRIKLNLNFIRCIDEHKWWIPVLMIFTPRTCLNNLVNMTGSNFKATNGHMHSCRGTCPPSSLLSSICAGVCRAIMCSGHVNFSQAVAGPKSCFRPFKKKKMSYS